MKKKKQYIISRSTQEARFLLLWILNKIPNFPNNGYLHLLPLEYYYYTHHPSFFQFFSLNHLLLQDFQNKK
ncbi:hypothetical protein L6452_07900 [Arctium lappa]|uniref:Uncharacterized protein n=1 Tax=Arctium lappa TaxID=4217 RepID=A0ACB9EM68_ARCLA|nr:hypothetical protein L6452_07900 [Arctium lappa]